MARFNFCSLEQPEKIGYSFDSQEYSQRPAVDECCLAWDTFGDGMCQHSGAWPIATERAADYFASLASHLLEHPENMDSLSWKLRQEVNVKDIEFAASVIYREPKDDKPYKRQYYSKQERKVSGADKRNDRRYEEVKKWMDGRPEAIVQLLWQSFYSPFQTYSLNCAVRDWAQAGEGRGWMDLPTLAADWDQEKKRTLHSSYDLLQGVLRHLEGIRSMRSSLDCWKHNLENRQRIEAEKNAAPAEMVAV